MLDTVQTNDIFRFTIHTSPSIDPSWIREGDISRAWKRSVTKRFLTQPKDEHMNHSLDQLAKDCIDACNHCATECGICFSHMVGMKSDNDCPACCIECAAMCRFCADSIARSSPFAKQICSLCADICSWCAEQCEAHDMEHCKRCAESCRRCAEACRAMAG